MRVDKVTGERIGELVVFISTDEVSLLEERSE